MQSAIDVLLRHRDDEPQVGFNKRTFARIGLDRARSHSLENSVHTIPFKRHPIHTETLIASQFIGIALKLGSQICAKYQDSRGTFRISRDN